MQKCDFVYLLTKMSSFLSYVANTIKIFTLLHVRNRLEIFNKNGYHAKIPAQNKYFDKTKPKSL